MSSKKAFPGKGLSNTQTCSSKGSYAPNTNLTTGGGSSLARGPHRAPPKGTELPGKGLSKTQTRNSNPNKLN